MLGQSGDRFQDVLTKYRFFCTCAYCLNSQTEYDVELKEVIDTYNDASFFSKVVGFSHLNHDRPRVGNFVAEAIRAKMGVDLTFQNTGGVRSNLDYGDISKREIFEIL